MSDCMGLVSTAIAFIDSALPDFSTLRNGIKLGTEVITIDAARDGVAQIARSLKNRNNIQSIHIISHGSPASLQLGAIDLNLTNLKKYGKQLQVWGRSLAENAEILLYGCEVAAGDAGANFLQQLSKLTGAKIAASSTPIGSAALGGNWVLDCTTGEVFSELAIDPTTRTAYQFAFGLQFLGQAGFPANTDLTFGTTTRLGGLSGLTYAGNNTYYAISDGRNIPVASPDPSRFYTLTIPTVSSGSLTPAPGQVVFTGVTQIGNPPPFAADTSDTEGIGLLGNNVFVSSEGNFSPTPTIQPFINRFDITTGIQNLALTIPTPKYDVSTDTTSGIRNNKGLESLTITPSQSFLFTATENALEQDGPDTGTSATIGTRSRILRYDLSTNTANGEFLYNTDPGNGISEMLAVDDNTLLVLERFFNPVTLTGDLKLYQISLTGATDIQNNTGLTASGVAGITPVSKTPIATTAYFLSLGSPPFGLADNFEGMTFGPPQTATGKRSLILVSDNNFAIPTRFTAFAANNAPVLNNSGAPTLTAINEDVLPASNTGSLVSALIAGAVTDADTADTQGIAVTATDNTNGSWEYSIDSGVTWTAFGTPSTAAARLLAGTASIRFVPNADYNGSANITYQAWDGTTTNSGVTTFTNGGTADISAASSIGGLAAFSTASETATITVNPVNDAPSFVKGADSSAIAGTAAQTVVNWATSISSGPANESTQTVSFNLSNNNNNLFSVQPAIDSAGNLTYTPAFGVSGTATVSATLSDNGGTANGGANTSAAQTFTINITADSIVPAAANLVASNVIVAGGTAQTFTVDYSDNVAVNSGSLDNSDIRVTGLGGFNQLATLVSFTPAGNGTLRTATYQIAAPGGSWDLGDNGNYAIAIESSQVSDINNNFVAASNLGSFNVNIPNPGSFNFSAANYDVSEGGGSATITVTRTSNTVAADVSYSTSDGTANAGSDYTATSGTLNFAIGETNKTFTILINDDTLVEGNESVALSLNNPTNGASLGAPSSASLTILDNDVAPTPTPTPTPTPNPIQVVGQIARKYFSLGGENSWLGKPVQNQVQQPGGFIKQLFENGHIVWNSILAIAYKEGTGKPNGTVPSSQPTTNFVSPQNWKAEFINRTPSNAGDINFNIDRKNGQAGVFAQIPNPAAVKNLGSQGANGKIKAILNADFGSNSPANNVQPDNFGMLASTQVSLEAGKTYKFTTKSDDGSAFNLKNLTTGQWMEEKDILNNPEFGNADWRDRGYKDPAKTVLFKVPQSGEYQLMFKLFDRTGGAQIEAKVEETFQDPVNIAKDWQLEVYKWDQGQNDPPPADIQTATTAGDGLEYMGSVSAGSNTRPDGTKGTSKDGAWYWGAGSPNHNDSARFPKDRFVVKGVTQADFDANRTYKFTVGADDGYQLYARYQDGTKEPITPNNQWDTDAYGSKTIDFTPKKTGTYKVVAYMYENTGDAFFDLSWKEVPPPASSGSLYPTLSKDDSWWDRNSGHSSQFNGPLSQGFDFTEPQDHNDGNVGTAPAEVRDIYKQLARAIFASDYGKGFIGRMNTGYIYDASYEPYPGAYHAGIDFYAPGGTPVKAVVGGTVEDIWPGGERGVFVYVKGTDGKRWVYGHLDSASDVWKGKLIQPGDGVGIVGYQSKAQHLHLEVQTTAKYTEGASTDQTWLQKVTMSPIEAYWQWRNSQSGGLNIGTGTTSNSNELGSLSEKYETAGRGPGTIGYDKKGGWSYGTYQLATNPGTLNDFIQSPMANKWKPELQGLTSGTKAFNKKWEEIASTDSEDFNTAQHEFIKKTHYDPFAMKLKNTLNLDVNEHSKALRDVIWSVAVQHGPDNNVVNNALKGKNISLMSESEIIKAIYVERGRKNSAAKLVYFVGSTPEVQKSVANRFVNEEADALAMLQAEKDK